jgi:hypothetical protein
MNRVAFPLEPETRGPVVADLQVGLRFLIDRDFFMFRSQDERNAIIKALEAEAADSFYNGATKELVTKCQDLMHLTINGTVDKPTANALNNELDKRRAFDLAVSQADRLVAGQVRRADGLPQPNTTVRAFHMARQVTVRLGEDVADAEGRITIRYEPLSGASGNIRV